MSEAKAFGAGFVSVLVFHQGLLALLHASGATPRLPWVTTPVPPFGVPQVISSAFWGGVWGVVLWAMVGRMRGSSRYWTWSLLFGAFALTSVSLFVVFPLKGQPVAAGWDRTFITGALLLNGAWGLGVALLMRLLARPAPHPT